MRKFLKKYFPGVMKIFNFYASWKYKNKTAKEVFESIHNNNSWEGDDSVSGQGSDLEQTEVIRTEIPKVLKEYQIKSFLDAPCGDHFWMSTIDLSDVNYIGGDIVQSLVDRCQKQFGSDQKSFIQIDLIEGKLPQADLVLVRDCFVHLPIDSIQKALKNIKESGAKYLLTTSFPEKSKNLDITTGGWRWLNFEKAPFNFPKPLVEINENCSEGKKFEDKSLVLWAVSDLPI